MNRSRFLPMIALLAGAALAGCRTTAPATVDVPEGFARFTSIGDYRIVSPEGVLLRIRSEANEPEQTLAFWAEALELQLERSGYALLEKGAFAAPAGEGVRFEWIAPVGEEDWIYLTAISVSGDRIVIVEGAGPYRSFREYRPAIHRSLSTLTAGESGPPEGR